MRVVARAPLAPWPAVVLSLSLLMGACGPGEGRDGGEEGMQPPSDTASAPAEERPAPTLRTDPQTLRLTGADGSSRELATFDAGSDSSFVAAALRPGSTAEQATVVAMVTGGEGYGLRWLAVDDGQAGPLRAFPDRYPVATSPGEQASGGRPTVAWTPDGGSVAWLEWTEDGETDLRTVGWADRPGTGDPATDNAAFSLGAVPAGSRIEGWVDDGGAGWRMRIGAPDGTLWSLRVERQADGALALPGPPVPDPG